ncbi:hypothetical protein DFH11DRAFT_737321 [Phellopilus nigrolimitatus]|nr:hypothetical protein DFH11DRAFT_737321 [Phellopilus nigrolimitatus]
MALVEGQARVLRTMLTTLDVDVLLHIISLLNVEDILSLRLTSRQIASITRLRTVWHNVLTRQVLTQDIPLTRSYSTSNNRQLLSYNNLAEISPSELEHAVRGALHANENWQRERPSRTRASRIQARVGRVDLLKFLKVHSFVAEADSDEVNDGRFLMSFGHGRESPSEMHMQVWDTEATGPDAEEGVQLVGFWSGRGRAIKLAMDEESGLHGRAIGPDIQQISRGTMVAISRSFETLGSDEISFSLDILCISPERPPLGHHPNVHTVKSFILPGPVIARALYGRYVALQVRADITDELGQGYAHGILKVVDWLRSTKLNSLRELGTMPGASKSNDEEEVAIELAFSAHGANRAVRHVQFQHDWVLVFRESVLEMYFLPPSVLGASASTRARVLHPVACHQWTWRIDSVVVTERVSWMHERAALSCVTCNGRGYVPDSGHASTSDKIDQQITCACRYRPLSIAVRFDSFFPWPVNLLHHYVLDVDQSVHFNGLEATPQAPYILFPTLMHTVPSSVRLFGHSILAMDRFGTLVWTDNEAAEYRVSQDTSAHGEAEVEAEHAPGRSSYGDSGERVAGQRLPLSSRPGSEAKAAHSAPLPSADTTVSEPDSQPEALVSLHDELAPATSLFGMRTMDGWCSIALSERAGRIALGDTDGFFELWDHF